MQRREFITLLGGAAAAWPLSARAQQAAMPVIGFLHAGSVVPMTPMLEGFPRGLPNPATSWHRTWRSNSGGRRADFDRLPALAAELVQRHVTVLIAGGGPETSLAVKTATSEIPILFVMSDDPSNTALLRALIDRAAVSQAQLFSVTASVAKRLDCCAISAAADGIAFLMDPNDIESEIETRDLQSAAQAVGQQITVLKAGNVSDLDAVFAGLVQPRAKAILVGTDRLLCRRP